MRLYLSYPMTRATIADRRVRWRVRRWLRRLRDEDIIESWFDPQFHESPDLGLAGKQNLDFEAMRNCQVLVVIWSASAYRSSGVSAEIEWARRVFNIPVLIYRPRHIRHPVPAWTSVTARSAGWYYLHTLTSKLLHFSLALKEPTPS